MTVIRESLAKYLSQRHYPASQTSIVMPVYSTCSEFRFETRGPTVNVSGKMNLQEDYYNLSLVDNNFDIVISATKPGLYTADVSALSHIKIDFSGNPEDIIYAFVE